MNSDDLTFNITLRREMALAFTECWNTAFTECWNTARPSPNEGDAWSASVNIANQMREQMPQPIEVGSKVSWNDHFDIFEVFAIAEHPRTGERYALIAAGDIAWRAPADDLRVVR